MNNRPSGSIPRKTTINDQPHMLAYINPQEAMMLKSMGGTGKPGPGGIPAFYYGGDFGEGGRGAGDSGPNAGGNMDGPGVGPGGGDGFSGGDQGPNDSGYVSQSGGGESPAARAAQLQAIEDQNAQNAINAAKVQEQQADDLASLKTKIDTPFTPKTPFEFMSKFNPVHMLGRLSAKQQNQTAYDQLSGKTDYSKGILGNLFSGTGAKTFSHYAPVKDASGNLVGSATVATDGTTMGYRGDRTVSVFGPPDVQGYVNAMNEAGQGGPDSPGGSEGPPPIIIDDDTEESGETTSTYNPEDYLVKNLDIIQPGTTVAGEVPTIYNQGGVVSLDPFNQLRNRM